ncbi:hypothetical protein [Spirosoma pomorum]
MTNNSFAKSINKSSSTINYIVEGKTKPGYELLEGIVTTYPAVNAEWLMKGEGDMMKQAGSLPSPEKPDKYLVEHLGSLESNFARLVNQLESKDNQIAGLQRVVDALLPGKHNGMPYMGRVRPLWGENELDAQLQAGVI